VLGEEKSASTVLLEQSKAELVPLLEKVCSASLGPHVGWHPRISSLENEAFKKLEPTLRLPISSGGLGLRSLTQTRFAAYYSSIALTACRLIKFKMQREEGTASSPVAAAC